MAGVVAHLFLKPERGSPMREVPEATAVAGKGLEGDASYGRGPRQVLIMEAEVLHRFGLAPGTARENILTRGLRLTAVTPGETLAVGTTLLEVTAGCDPCSFMDELQPGLQEAIRGERGILAQVVTSGRIGVGDAVEVCVSPDRREASQPE
jgi:MOSC domain-containing protein YiiM